jgi:HSP20 family protein
LRSTEDERRRHIMNTEVTRTNNNVQARERVIIPQVDIFENEHGYTVVADVPGVNRENLEITLNDGKLEITGRIAKTDNGQAPAWREYDLHDYYRSFTVGKEIDGNAIKATVENGVLTLLLPKREELKPRKIEIQSH